MTGVAGPRTAAARAAPAGRLLRATATGTGPAVALGRGPAAGALPDLLLRRLRHSPAAVPRAGVR